MHVSLKKNGARFLCFILISTFLPPAQAAPTVVFNGLFTNCVNLFSANNTHAIRMRALATTNIIGLNINVGTGLNSNWSTTKYWIVSHNASTNMPGTILETFTADSTSGSGSTTTVHFSGSYLINAGTVFYIIPSVSAATFPICYTNGAPSAEQIPNNGINVDTGTSLTNANWNKVLITGSFPGPNSSSWTLVSAVTQIWQLSIEGSSGPVSIAMTLPGGARSIDFNTPTSISVSVGSESRVTFFQNGKRIPGCLNLLTSAGSVTCSWRANVKGSISLTAAAIPIADSSAKATSVPLRLLVKPRSNNR